MSTGRRGGADQYIVISGGAADPWIIAGTVDPSAGAGVPAPEGSTYHRYGAGAGQLWLKTAAAATGWTNLGGGVGDHTLLHWGNDSVAASVDLRYLAPGYDQSTADLTRLTTFRAPRAGTAQRLRARHNAAAGNGNSVDYTLYVNGAPTALTCSLATGVIGDAQDLANTVAIAAGDQIEMTANKLLALGSGAVDCMVSMEIQY